MFGEYLVIHQNLYHQSLLTYARYYKTLIVECQSSYFISLYYIYIYIYAFIVTKIIIYYILGSQKYQYFMLVT